MNGTTEGNCYPENEQSEMALGRCLVDGDPEAASRARRTRRKTFGFSLAVEMLFLLLLVAAPLLTTVAQPSFSKPTFVPFFFDGTHLKHGVAHPTAPDRRQSNYRVDRITYILDHPLRVQAQPPESAGDPIDPSLDVSIGNSGADFSPFVGSAPAGPAAPPESNKKSVEKRPLKLSEPIVEAQLISRIEPRYPPLPLQLKKEGTVVLHAIIGRDGRINALEVVSGSPFFVQAALDAVRQWRYRPTMLNGEPVEVETSITVIFRLHE
jgi:protein TonB